jgi:hypothetical protein
MSSLPYSFGRGIAGSGRTLADKYRGWQDQIARGAQQAQEAYSGGSLLGVPLNPVADALETFGAGVRGEAIPGQDIELPQSRASLMEPEFPLAIAQHLGEKPAVGTDGIPEALRRPTGMNYPEPVAEPNGRVNVTINGKTYDYSGGKNGGAPLAGGQLGSLFGKPWTNEATDQTHEFAGEGNGSYSQMTENPALKSLGQLKDEQAIADARPAAQGGSVGEQRGIAQSIAQKQAEYDARAGAEVNAERGKSGVRLDEQAARRDAYESAVAEEINDYQAAKSAIEGRTDVDPEKKAAALAEVQARHEAQRQAIRESFGFGQNLGAALRQD